MANTVRVKVGETWYTVEIEDLNGNPVHAIVDGQPVEVEVQQLNSETPSPETSRAQPESPAPNAAPAPPPTPATPVSASNFKKFRTPMPGVILSISVNVGDKVITGDEICILEAMKMQQTLRADWSGIVRAIHVIPGQQVSDGAPIIDLE